MKRALTILLAACIAVGCFAGCRRDEVPPDTEVVDIDVPRTANVSLSELMADNEGFYLNCFDDWTELFNADDEAAELDSYYLTKDEPGCPVLKLDGLTVPAKGYLVVKLGDDAPFHLSKEGDSLLLFRQNELCDKLTFTDPLGTASWTHDGVCEKPTPGFENTDEGYEKYVDSVGTPPLVINEAVSSNGKYPAPDGGFYDFVEVCNCSGDPVLLSDYFLSDKRSEPRRYRFPELTLGPGEYFVVWCSGGAWEGHAPFKISSSGEKLYLSDAEGIIDFMEVPGDLQRDDSYGRNGGALVYMSVATPGAQNADGYETSIVPPTASLPTGAYDEPVSVELSGSGTIYYTLDGSKPTVNSRVYTEPIRVEHMASIRAFCIDGDRESELTSFFYIVDVEHAFPILNVAIRQDYLTGDKGVLNHIDPEYEHQAYITMMDGGKELFSAPCGFKLHGNDSKKGAKQNFQLRFREKYGLSKLEYKVFENRDIEKFNSLILKGGSEDYPFCGFRDELCTSLVDGATELSVQAYRPVILYLNGQYWGIYWLRERFDDEYCAQRLGVSDESINMLKDYGNAVVSGSRKSFSDLVKYCKTHDLRDDECYKYVMRRIDSTSMMDWYICRSYFGDSDLANIRFYSSDEADGRWHWCFFDLDWAMWNNNSDPIGNTARDDGHHVIMLSLLKNAKFRDAFLKRYALLMKSILNEQAITARADEFVKLMEPEIKADREKYGYTVSAWRSAVEKLKSYVKDGKRDKTVLKGIQSYFGLSDAQMIQYFGRTK